jgi:small subunit ribosomal protein S1
LIHSFPSITLQSIKNAFDADIPVTGKVASELKGGYEIRVGKVRCFCPYSQMDLKGSRDAGTYIGETFPFKCLNTRNGTQYNLSRRALMEKELEKERKAQEPLPSVGYRRQGAVDPKVRRLCRIGGIDGLIPLSESRGSRVQDREPVSIGTGEDENSRRLGKDWITLSLKAVLTIPSCRYLKIP